MQQINERISEFRVALVLQYLCLFMKTSNKIKLKSMSLNYYVNKMYLCKLPILGTMILKWAGVSILGTQPIPKPLQLPKTV